MRPVGRSIRIGLASVTAFLLFFRAKWAFTLYGPYDAPCYVAWLYSALGLARNDCVSNSYFPGVAALWYPAGGLGRVLSAITKTEPDVWIFPLIALSSFLAWVGALFLIDAQVEKTDRRPNSYWLSIILMLNIPVLYYATHRTMLSHAGEIFLAVAVTGALLANRLGLAFALSLWLCATRINDFPVLALVGARAWELRRSISRRFWILFGTFSGGVVAVLLTIGFHFGYNGTKLYLSSLYTPLLFPSFERTAYVFAAADWGLFWTAPLWLLSLALGILYFRRLTWVGRAALFWMAIELYICLRWQGNGRDFAYRYLIGSYVAAFLILRELAGGLSTVVRKGVAAVAVVGATWMTYLTWVYKSRPEFFPRYLDWGFTQPSLQWDALRALGRPKWLLEPFGLSPIGYSLFSWLGETSLFAPYQSYLKYAGQGATRVAISLYAVIAGALLLFLSARLIRLKKP